MFERISNSFALAKSSWQVLRRDKQLVVFPMLSGVACLFVLVSFWAPVVFGVGLERMIVDDKPAPWVYVVLFAYYFATYFVVVFFNAALVSCALMRFHGQTPTVADGLRAASLRLPQILAWALVSASVGILLRAIENVHEKAGAIISAILGTLWSVITYFVVPVLVVERVGPIEAIKRSAGILKKTWGEALVGNLGLGLFMLLVYLPGILLLAGGVVILANGGNMLAIGLALLALAVVYFVIAAAIGSALQGIYITALYEYAAYGSVPQGFEGDTFRYAFRSRNS